MPVRSKVLFALGTVVFLLVLGVWILNVSRPGSRIEGCGQSCDWTPQPSSSSRRPGPLRVLSLNVLHGFPRFQHLDGRLELIAAEIRRLDADVVCLQEVPWHWGSAAQRLAEQTGLYYFYVRANGGRWTVLFEEGEAILSRYPLREPSFLELQPQAGLFQHRVALQAIALTPWGDLRVVSTHLTHNNPEANRSQTWSLSGWVGRAGSVSVPAIVAGDFNAPETSVQIQSLVSTSSSLGWIDTYRQVHPGEPGYTCCVDDITGEPGQPLTTRIDYLFVVPGDGPVEVISSQHSFDHPARLANGWLWASDHVGLFTELSW